MTIKAEFTNLNVVGVLKTMKLEARKSAKGSDMIIGNMVVEVEDNVKNVLNNIRVEVLQMRLTGKEQKENPMYKSMQTVMEEYKSIDIDGRAQADTISVVGSVEINDYQGRDGNMRSNMRFSGRFFNRVEATTAHKAEFDAKVAVVGYTPVVDADGLPVEPETDSVEAYTVGYQNVITPLKGLVIHQDENQLLTSFKGLYQPGSTGQLLVKINNYPDTTEPEEQPEVVQGFGQTIQPRTFTKFINELEIIGGNMPLEEGLGYTADEIQEIKDLRRKQLAVKSEVSAEPVITMPTAGFGKPTPPAKEGVGGVPVTNETAVQNGDLPKF